MASDFGVLRSGSRVITGCMGNWKRTCNETQATQAPRILIPYISCQMSHFSANKLILAGSDAHTHLSAGTEKLEMILTCTSADRSRTITRGKRPSVECKIANETKSSYRSAQPKRGRWRCRSLKSETSKSIPSSKYWSDLPSCWNRTATVEFVTGMVAVCGGCIACRSPAPNENFTNGPPKTEIDSNFVAVANHENKLTWRIDLNATDQISNQQLQLDR